MKNAYLHGQPCLPAPFSRAVGQKSKFRSQHFFASLSQFQKGVTRPPCPKTPGGDIFGRNPLLGVRAWPRGPWVQVTHPKITCEEFSRPWKFGCQPTNMSKVIWLCSGDAHTDRQTHRQTDTHTQTDWHTHTRTHTHTHTHRHTFAECHHYYKGIFFCMEEGGKHYEPYNISTSSLREG